MTIERDDLLDACVRLPDHVVHRSFIAETVLLNLKNGHYHGLNPVGGFMLEALNESTSVREAVERVAEHYQEDPERVEADLLALCQRLLEQDLVEVVEPDRR